MHTSAISKQRTLIRKKMPSLIVTLFFLFAEILKADSDDPLIIVDQQEPVDETRLPNAHSAALVMSLILLCVVLYGIYRLCKAKCGKPKVPLTVSLGDNQSHIENSPEGLEEHIKEREAYLAIFGPKKNASNASGSVSRTEKDAEVGP